MPYRPLSSGVEACAVLLGLAAGAASGATYTITTLADDASSNGNCTLREAIGAAASGLTMDQCAGDPAVDEIVLDAVGTYPFAAGAMTVSAATIRIRGDADHARGSYAVDMQDLNRFLVALNGSDVRLERLVLKRGYGDTSILGSGSFGGAVAVHNSSLTLRDVRVADSRSIHGGGLGFRADVVGSTLDLENVVLAGNEANFVDVSSQRSGGGLYVETNVPAALRLVKVRFLGNAIVATEANRSGFGGGAYFLTNAATSFEGRHLEFEGNWIDATQFASGGGFYASFGGSGAFRLEDVDLTGNDFTGPAAITSGAAFDFYLGGSALPTVRRMRVLANGVSSGSGQALVRVVEPSAAAISDLLVADGAGYGLYLDVQCLTCSAVAGNLTVTGHPGSGLTLGENNGSLRVENSIVWNNATSSGSNLNVAFGTPDLSPENLVGVDPLFADEAGGDYRPGPLSPAIDAGDQTFASVGPWDAGHGARVLGLDVDLGALERGAVFSDDFEHGDAWAWSASAP